MNFMFWNLKRKFYRTIYQIKLLDKHFFDKVHIKNRKLKKHIMDWMIEMNYYKEISIPKFSYLFNDFESILFPITIDGIRGELTIIDDYGNDYYLSYSPFDCHKIGEYTIGKMTYPFYKDCSYCLTKNGDIILKKFVVMQINGDKINTDNIITFNYDLNKQLTTAVLKTKTLCLEICYPILKYVYDDKISSYLFDIANQFPYIDDLLPIFEIITNVIKDMNVFQGNYSLTMKSFYNTKTDKELLSEICLSDGIITKYSFTSKESLT